MKSFLQIILLPKTRPSTLLLPIFLKILPWKKKKKSALGRVINKNVGGLLAVFKRNKKNTLDENEPGFVKFLDQSLIVFNTITGSDKELTKVYNKDGKLSSYGFEGGTVNLRRNLGKQ